jgi:hypothetical protein
MPEINEQYDIILKGLLSQGLKPEQAQLKALWTLLKEMNTRFIAPYQF